MQVTLNPQNAAIPVGPLEWHLLLIRAGDAVPALLTDANRKAAERLLWASGHFECKVAVAGNQVFEMHLELGTSRQFERGDRVILVVVNRTGAASGAGGGFEAMGDSFIFDHA